MHREALLNGYEPWNLLVGGAAYLAAALGATLFGDVSIIIDVLASSGLGTVAGHLIVLARARRGIVGREPQIVAAWTAFGAVVALGVHVVVGLS